MKYENLLTEREQRRLYLVHHMHHFKKRTKGKNVVVHDLHHCYLFSKKNMKGEKFKIGHLLFNNKIFHVLNKKHSGFLYDHENNKFKVKEIVIKNKKYFFVG